MARPAKSISVLETEKKSHRTKAELEVRRKGEAELSTGEKLKERPETKNNPIAHKEFRRVNKLLTKLGKNDALYEPIINRYCMLQADCAELAEMKLRFAESKSELEEEYRAGKESETGLTASSYYKLLASMQSNILSLDKQLQAKQKMILDIEKECSMTISAALRSIPKTPEKKENPLLSVLADND